jgi:hypothetical protein
LLKSRKSIPEARLQELEEIVMRFYGVQSLPSELLESTLKMEIK